MSVDWVLEQYPIRQSVYKEFDVIASMKSEISKAESYDRRSMCSQTGSKMYRISILQILLLSLHVNAGWSLNAITDNAAEIGGQHDALAVMENILFISEGCNFRVYDIKNPKKPVQIYSHRFDDIIQDIVVQGKRLYVSVWRNKVFILDVNQPGDPIILGSYMPKTGSPKDLDIDDNILAISCFPVSIELVDVSNPASPKSLSTNPAYICSALEVAENRLFVGRMRPWIDTINITDPKNILLLNTCQTSDEVNQIRVVESTMYVANGNAGVSIYNIGSASTPNIISQIDTRGYATDVIVSGTTIYVACNNEYTGFQIFDISKREKPALCSEYDTRGNASSICLSGNTLIISDGAMGILLVDVSDRRKPRLLGQIPLLDEVFDVSVSKNVAVALTIEGVLACIDISEISSPKVSGMVSCSIHATSIDIKDNYAFLPTVNEGVQIVDIADPRKPEIRSVIRTRGRAFDISILGENVLIAEGSEGIEIADVSAPANPRIIAQIDTPGEAHGIDFANGNAIIADGTAGLVIVDISTPSNPKVISHYPIDLEVFVNASDVTVYDDIALLDIRQPYLLCLDISDTDSITPVSSYSLGDYAYCTDIIMESSKAIIANDRSVVQIVDFTKPDSPELLRAIELIGNPLDLALSENYLFVAASTGGLQILKNPLR